MIKKSEVLKAELEALVLQSEMFQKSLFDGDGRLLPNHVEIFDAYHDGEGKHYFQNKERLRTKIMIEERREVEVGDGVTICLFSDRHAGTVIKRTKCSITVQLDTATLDPNFKPEIIEGGFVGHCINQNEQTYTYERNPNGSIDTYRWSEKRGIFQCGDIKVINGRKEFYDYNF